LTQSHLNGFTASGKGLTVGHLRKEVKEKAKTPDKEVNCA